MFDFNAAPQMQVQVFLTGDHVAEVNAELIGIEFRAPWVSVKTRDVDGREMVYHVPVAAVRMIRITELKGEI